MSYPDQNPNRAREQYLDGLRAQSLSELQFKAKKEAFAAGWRAACEEAAKIADKAFEQSWVVQDAVDHIRSLPVPEVG